MQRSGFLGALLAAAILPLVSFAAQAEDIAVSAAPAYRLSTATSLRNAPTLNLSQTRLAMPAKSDAAIQPDKTAVIVNKLLTIDDHVHLSPSTHSDIDVMTPEREQNRPKGAYLNLKINW